MEQITVRIPADELEELEAEADEHGVSRSEHIRDTLESRHEHDADTAEHEAEVERLRDEVAELERVDLPVRQPAEQRERDRCV